MDVAIIIIPNDTFSITPRRRNYNLHKIWAIWRSTNLCGDWSFNRLDDQYQHFWFDFTHVRFDSKVFKFLTFFQKWNRLWNSTPISPLVLHFQMIMGGVFGVWLGMLLFCYRCFLYHLGYLKFLFFFFKLDVLFPLHHQRTSQKPYCPKRPSLKE